MAPSLLSPPKSRTRASSTSLRPAPVCHSLGRRRSTSFLRVDDDACAPTAPPTEPPPTMLAWFVSHWLHLPDKHSLSWSTPSSPRSSSDEFILPLSASATTPASLSLALSGAYIPARVHTLLTRLQIHAPILFVVLLFPISTALVLWCLSTLPISLSWPHNIVDLAQLGRELHAYTQSGPGPLSHVVGVMAISAVWKHAWSIPGSVLWNVLGGALFSPLYATVLLTSLTTRTWGRLRIRFGSFRQSPKSSAWVRLSVLRLIGVVPWSGINIACGVCGVPLVDCMLGTFIGCLPWTAVTCQIGDILQTVASSPNQTSKTVSSLLTTPEIVLKLVFLSILSLAPILGRRQLRSLLSNQPRSADTVKDPRWTWIQDWRTRLASRSRSRGREQDQQTLIFLVDEKRQLEHLEGS
ncbi:hypothetical protein BJ912DRAFT_1018267 [Pholiota molesta]|nr:hypothetical protein BJ912DRAFT_1018267 [Pholiota molesta]